jgi:hypothetical protein
MGLFIIFMITTVTTLEEASEPLIGEKIIV